MNNDPGMVDFVKALTDPTRLKIIGLLADHPASLQDVTAELSISTRKAYNHLEFLKFVHAVHERDGLFHLDENALETLSRQQLAQREKPLLPTWDADPSRQKALSLCLNPDGTISRIPNSRTQSSRFRILLEYLASSFELDVQYTEKQVNDILRHFHVDVAGLRRDLVDAGLLARETDGSRYWRVSANREGNEHRPGQPLQSTGGCQPSQDNRSAFPPALQWRGVICLAGSEALHGLAPPLPLVCGWVGLCPRRGVLQHVPSGGESIG